MPDPGTEPQFESCPATRDARGIAPIPCALPLGHAGEHRSKGGTTWAGIVPQDNSLRDAPCHFDDDGFCYVHPFGRCGRPEPDIEPQFIVFQGYVREAGGGVVLIVVNRDTDYYPPVGAEVAVIRRNTDA